MAIIEISNIRSKIVSATPKALIAAHRVLSVPTPGHEYTEAFRKGWWDGLTRFYTSSNNFPTGLYSQVVEAISKTGERVAIKDLRYDIPGVSDDVNWYYYSDEPMTLLDPELGTITLRDYQRDAVIEALRYGRGVINVATNGGKTEIACKIVDIIYPHLQPEQRLVFFTHSRDIMYQTIKRIKGRCSIPVGIIGDEQWEEESVMVVMIPTITKYLKLPKKAPVRRRKGQTEEQYFVEFKEKMKRVSNFLKTIYGFIADEVHHASSDAWYDLFMKLDKAYYRIGLTGSIDESKVIETKKLFGSTGKIISKISNKFLIENGYSAVPTVYLFNTKGCPEIDCYYEEARQKCIMYHGKRNKIFLEKIIQKAQDGKQCLVIVGEIDHGILLENLLQGYGFTVQLSHGDKSTKSRDKALGGLKNGDLRVLIATQILDEGIDVPGINCLFIVAGGKSLRQVLQRVGRGLRKKSDGSGLEIYDCLDYHNVYLLEHSLERYNIYKEEEFQVIQL